MKRMVVYALSACALGLMLLVCIGAGSVPIAPRDTLAALLCRDTGLTANIVVQIRLPRALCAALCGAALALCGAAMQGLLRNPLADGSTLGVSSGAALGAVAALALGASLPGGPAIPAMAAACVSLAAILSLAFALDRSLETSSIILVGVIFSMFASSAMTLIVSFAGDQLRAITFWTMGSLSGAGYGDAALLAAALAVFGGIILRHARELNAFAVGEDNARAVGVDVRRVKLALLVGVSALIGVCVAVGGTIGFVGLIVPHMARMLVGPNHARLLPASMLGGAMLLLACDLAARTAIAPAELSVGVVTSLLGAAAFIAIFYQSRKGR